MPKEMEEFLTSLNWHSSVTLHIWLDSNPNAVDEMIEELEKFEERNKKPIDTHLPL